MDATKYQTTEGLATTGLAGYLAAGQLANHRMGDEIAAAAGYCLDAPCCVPTGSCKRPDSIIHCTRLRPGDWDMATPTNTAAGSQDAA